VPGTFEVPGTYLNKQYARTALGSRQSGKARYDRRNLLWGAHKGQTVTDSPFVAGRTIEDTLQQLGYLAFMAGQREAIDHLLAGRDTLVVLPTGAGKSLIYQLAALHLPGLCIVVSPLIALTQDQVDKLQAQQIPATFVNSSLSEDEQAERLEAAVRGDYKILYVTPERLQQEAFLEQIQQVEVGLLAVDEAHSISEWGHDFRPEYLRIGDFRRAVGCPVTVAVTATATPQVKEEIAALLELRDVREVSSGFDRPEIKFCVRRVPDTGAEDGSPKLALIREIFEERPETTAIVYVATRKAAEEVAAFLQDALKRNAAHYHAGLPSSQRTEVQDAFLDGELPVVVATNAFGMGIDRPDVRLVLHHALPGSLEAYYQEAGRAGRDGQASEAILLYDRDDRQLHDYFNRQGDIEYGHLQRLYQELRERQEASGGSSSFELDTADLARETRKARIGLQRLEEAGVVELGAYDGDDRTILLKEWDEDVVRAVVANAEAAGMHRQQQLEKMLAYAENEKACRRALLLAHFGDEAPDEIRADCCDTCAGKLEVAAFVAEIEEEVDEPADPEPLPALAETILASVRTFAGLRTAAQLVDLLHGDEKGHNQFRHSDFHGALAGYEREAIWNSIGELIAGEVLAVSELDTLSAT
jgi:ATP-dependent DNA helicase RecQ